MKLVTKEINGMKYTFSSDYYNNLFTGFIIHYIDDKKSSVIVPELVKEYTIPANLEQCIKWCNDTNEQLLTLLFQAGMSLNYLSKPLPNNKLYYKEKTFGKRNDKELMNGFNQWLNNHVGIMQIIIIILLLIKIYLTIK